MEKVLIKSTGDHSYAVKLIKYNVDIINFIKTLPSRYWNPEKKIWTIEGEFWLNKLVSYLALKNISFTLDEKINRDLKRINKKESKNLEKPKSKFESWGHQIEAYNFIKNKSAAMLNMGMGTGKTKTVIDTIANAEKNDKILIIAPKSVCQVWEPQFRMFQDLKHRFIDFSLMNGTIAKKTKKAQQLMIRKKFIVILNYDIAWRKDMADFLDSIEWDFIVLDESHRIKGQKSKVSKYLATLARKNPESKKLCLTGTPMANSPLDIFGQYRFLDPNIFGDNWYPFFYRYATVKKIPVMGKSGMHDVDIVTGYQRQGEMNEAMRLIMYEAKRDVLDLPEAQDIELHFDLEPKEMDIYNELKKEAVLIQGNKAMSAQHVLTRMIRLQQIVSGYAVDDETKEMFEVGKSKIKFFEDLLMDFPKNEPIVIFCRFKNDIKKIKEISENQDRTVAELSGSKNELKEFQSGERDVIIVQIQSGSMGIDLTRSHYTIYYSLDFSLGNYEQSRARVHRPGQKNNVTYYHLVARNTIDEKIYAALKSKKEIIKEIMTAGFEKLPF